MKKFLIFLLILIITPIIGGLYGIVHDQLTYTISPEYYSKFKFYQFGLIHEGDEEVLQNPRLQVCAIGFMATWWMGLPIGLILALVVLRMKTYNQMFKVAMEAILITMLVAFITGLIGLIYGRFFWQTKEFIGGFRKILSIKKILFQLALCTILVIRWLNRSYCGDYFYCT